MKNKLFCFLVLVFSQFLFCQVKFVSWNIENFGQSKDNNEISFIANVLKKYDVVAIQEVVAGYGGSKAVAKLSDELNRKGAKWDYVVSDPTHSSAYKTERYAYLWKTSKVKKIGNAWLEKKYKVEIDREPFYCTFQFNSQKFTLVNFHAITKSKQPETEIKFFKFLPSQYPNLNLIFVGDFNCSQSHSVFNPLKKLGFSCVFINQKTTLKKKCKSNNCLASAYDNIWYDTSKVRIGNAKAIHFYQLFETIIEARRISDHLPIFAEFIFK